MARFLLPIKIITPVKATRRSLSFTDHHHCLNEVCDYHKNRDKISCGLLVAKKFVYLSPVYTSQKNFVHRTFFFVDLMYAKTFQLHAGNFFSKLCLNKEKTLGVQSFSCCVYTGLEEATLKKTILILSKAFTQIRPMIFEVAQINPPHDF